MIMEDHATQAAKKQSETAGVQMLAVQMILMILKTTIVPVKLTLWMLLLVVKSRLQQALLPQQQIWKERLVVMMTGLKGMDWKVRTSTEQIDMMLKAWKHVPMKIQSSCSCNLLTTCTIIGSQSFIVSMCILNQTRKIFVPSWRKLYQPFFLRNVAKKLEMVICKLSSLQTINNFLLILCSFMNVMPIVFNYTINGIVCFENFYIKHIKYILL